MTDKEYEKIRKNEEEKAFYNRVYKADPTAYQLLNLERHAEIRFKKLLHTIFTICNFAGFELQGRITLVDKKTGRVWK